MAKPKKKENNERPKYSIKQSHPGKQCRRGEPIYYEEKKQPISLTLTPTAINKLTALASEISVSRSEFIEQLLREISSEEARNIINRKTE